MDISFGENTQSFGELMRMWSQVKQVIIDLNCEKFALQKQIEVMSDNREWYLQNTQQLAEESDKLKELVSSQQKAINELIQYKEECTRLQNTVLELTASINENEVSHKTAIDQMKNEFELEVQQMRNQLTDAMTRDAEEKVKLLADIIGQRDKQITELRTDVELLECSKDQEISRMKTEYEAKIEQTNENLVAYQRIAERTEQTCKLKCMQSIEKIKSDSEEQLFTLRQENQQLKDNITYLNLEMEARKVVPMSGKARQSTGAPNAKSSATKPKSEKIAIKILNYPPNSDLNEQLSKPVVPLQNPKRKKLPQCDPIYLEYLNHMYNNNS